MEEKIELVEENGEIELLNQRIEGMKEMESKTKQYLSQQEAYTIERQRLEEEAAATSGNSLWNTLTGVAKLVTAKITSECLGDAAAGAAPARPARGGSAGALHGCVQLHLELGSGGHLGHFPRSLRGRRASGGSRAGSL